MKLNLGAGSVPEVGWVNVDLLPLPGIDVVHNLGLYPWPFDDASATDVKALDVLEHLPNYTRDDRPGVIAFVEECHRILEPGGTLFIRTPGWDAAFLWIDPTHVRGFDPQSMDFFDPSTDFGRSTGFYSEAKFEVHVLQLSNRNLEFSMIKR